MQTTSPEQRIGRTSRRRTAGAWLGIGVLVFLLGAAWAAATPLMGSPDEPSHVVRAAAVARGQWNGELGPAPSDSSRPGAGTIVQLPSDFAEALSLPNCFAFQPDVSASCQQDVPPANGALVPVETFAGQYPPLYYLLVGWPSLGLGAEASIYAMRLVSAALTAALLTWGVFRLTRVPGSRSLMWGAAAAVTPMCLFLGGTVNPQGLEIAAAFSFWAACLALVARRATPSMPAMVQAAVSGALLVNTRTSSPFWALVIVAVTLIAAPAGRWREIVRQPSARWAGAVAALATGTAVAWVAVHRAVVTGGHLFPQYASLRSSASAILSDSTGYVLNMIGNFGWLDAPAPDVTNIAWYVAAGSLLLLAFVINSPVRTRAALVLLVLAVLGAPFALQIPTATDTGIIWQGRYALPIAIGVPLVAALLADPQHSESREIARRMTRVCIALLLVAQVAAFWSAARRYSEGATGKLLTLTPHWSSPIGYLSGVAAYAVVASALAYFAWRATRPARAPVVLGAS